MGILDYAFVEEGWMGCCVGSPFRAVSSVRKLVSDDGAALFVPYIDCFQSLSRLSMRFRSRSSLVFWSLEIRYPTIRWEVLGIFEASLSGLSHRHLGEALACDEEGLLSMIPQYAGIVGPDRGPPLVYVTRRSR